MTPEKVEENRLRRIAERQGLRLTKSRRRDPLAADFGTFTVADAATGTVLHVDLDVDSTAKWLDEHPVGGEHHVHDASTNETLRRATRSERIEALADEYTPASRYREGAIKVADHAGYVYVC
jgi:hypothetical protein